MNKAQKEKFEQSDCKVGTVSELFELTTAEQALLETKLRFGDAVRALRLNNNLSLKELAQRIGSSQPRVAKLENATPRSLLNSNSKPFSPRSLLRKEGLRTHCHLARTHRNENASPCRRCPLNGQAHRYHAGEPRGDVQP